MKCTIEGCKRPFKARGFCATHYHAWWVKQPAKRRNRTYGRKRIKNVGYIGMVHRVTYEFGPAKRAKCVDCGKSAKAWTWNQTCKKVVYGDAGPNAIHLTPFCRHTEHYEARCIPCRNNRTATLAK